MWSLFSSVRVYKSLHFPPILLVKLGFCLFMFQFILFLLLYLCSFAIYFEFNIITDLIKQYIQSGNKINYVFFTFVFTLFRSSQRRCFVKKPVLKNCATFKWKQLCWSLCLIKLQTFRSVTSSKRDSNADIFL